MTTALIVVLAVVSTLAAGLATAPGGVRAALDRRGWIIVLATTAVALPALAWALARGLALGPAGAGLIIAAAAPGGSTGPLLALLAGGDAAVTVALYVVLSIAGVASALAAALVFDVADPIAVARAAALVVAVSLIPLAVGLLARRRRPALAATLASWLSAAGAVLLVATIAVLIATRASAIAHPRVLLAAAIVVVASLAPGLAAGARAPGLAVAQVSAVRNLTLALVVLAAVGAPAAAIGATLSYGLVMYLVTGAVAVAARRV